MNIKYLVFTFGEFGYNLISECENFKQALKACKDLDTNKVRIIDIQKGLVE